MTEGEITDDSQMKKVQDGSCPSNSTGKTVSRKVLLHQLKKQRVKERRRLSKPAKTDTAVRYCLPLTFNTSMLKVHCNKKFSSQAGCLVNY